MSATATAMESKAEHKGLHIALWCVQVVLAIAFGIAGFMKLTTPISELSQTMGWVQTAPAALVRFIGVAETLGAIGLLAPGFTGIYPKLTAAAAAALTFVMSLAIALHVSRGELMFLPPPLILGTLSAFVAWGRFAKVPLAERAYW